jgi:hypothetical protein
MVLGFRSAVPPHTYQERRIKILHCSRESQGTADGIGRRHSHQPAHIGLYECLKAALIERLSDSVSKRVEKLLETQDLGDRKPSQLLRDMRKLAGSAVSDDFLTTMWKNRLPANMRAILVLADVKDVNKLMETASTR